MTWLVKETTHLKVMSGSAIQSLIAPLLSSASTSPNGLRPDSYPSTAETLRADQRLQFPAPQSGQRSGSQTWISLSIFLCWAVLESVGNCPQTVPPVDHTSGQQRFPFSLTKAQLIAVLLWLGKPAAKRLHKRQVRSGEGKGLHLLEQSSVAKDRPVFPHRFCTV